MLWHLYVSVKEETVSVDKMQTARLSKVIPEKENTISGSAAPCIFKILLGGSCSTIFVFS